MTAPKIRTACGRSVTEWIGSTPDAKIPDRVKLRVFERAGGVCHISGRKITASDKWDADHIVALADGGEHRESNLAPAIRTEHRRKTAGGEQGPRHVPAKARQGPRPQEIPQPASGRAQIEAQEDDQRRGGEAMTPNEKDLALRLRRVARVYHEVDQFKIAAVHGEYGARSLEKRLHACGWVNQFDASITPSGFKAMERAAGEPLRMVAEARPRAVAAAISAVAYDEASSRPRDSAARVLGVLSEAGGWMNSREIVAALGDLNGHQVRGGLASLRAKGLVEADGRSTKKQLSHYRAVQMEAAE